MSIYRKTQGYQDFSVVKVFMKKKPLDNLFPEMETEEVIGGYRITVTVKGTNHVNRAKLIEQTLKEA